MLTLKTGSLTGDLFNLFGSHDKHLLMQSVGERLNLSDRMHKIHPTGENHADKVDLSVRWQRDHM